MSAEYILCFRVKPSSPFQWVLGIALIGCSYLSYKSYKAIVEKLTTLEKKIDNIYIEVSKARSISTNTEPISALVPYSFQEEEVIGEVVEEASQRHILDSPPDHYKATTDISSRLIRDVRKKEAYEGAAKK